MTVFLSLHDAVVTDLCLLRPDPQTKELIVTSIHRGISREDIAQQTGWQIRFADTVEQTPPPTETELAVLHDLQARTEQAHTKHAAPYAARAKEYHDKHAYPPFP